MHSCARVYLPCWIGIALVGVLGASPWFSSMAADWPMWRGDAARTATSADPLPEKLHLQWVREYPSLKPAFWQVRQERLQFDLGYEPVVLGKRLFVASSRNDSVTALDAQTGEELWRFYADGPVRLAPAAWNDKVYFGSDDGWFYCLAADSGKLVWKAQGAPSSRKVLGNGRLISVWPARGGAVLQGNRVFFTAGIWPFEGIFVHSRSAQTGQSLWINDRLGSMYTTHPHAAMSFGGPSPQGYLLIHSNRLVLPSSRAFPAFLNPNSGELISFDFGHGGHGSRPGSWFVAGMKDGGLAVDSDLNAEIHDEGLQKIGQRGARPENGEQLPERVVVGEESYQIKSGIARAIRVGSRELRFQEGFPGVDGTIHTMLTAGGRLFVTTRAGAIYCFGEKQVTPRHHSLRVQPLQKDDGQSNPEMRAMLSAGGHDGGYALVWGLGNGRLAKALAADPEWHTIVVDRQPEKIDAFRQRLDAAGVYGEKIAAHSGDPVSFGWPQYVASLIACEDLPAAGIEFGEPFIDKTFDLLRPYGGRLCLKLSTAQHDSLAAMLKRPSLEGAQLSREGGLSILVRAGALPGAANYTGNQNFDERVKAPVGLLWYGDTFQHHKLFYEGVIPDSGRGLPSYIRVVDGVMSYRIPEPVGISPKKVAYADFLQQLNAKPHTNAYTDIYTGRTLSSVAPSHGAAAYQLFNPEMFPSLVRKNPITGAEEAREYIKNHGCDLVGADYGHLITMRSGTAALYDKRLESGTINISGLRSGCRNTVIPAGGVLSLPSWTGNCSCNYPVYTSMALVPMPESYEQWTAWGGLAESGPIRRLGLNFGAPGDRITDDGTLWLDWPQAGGPSPEIRLAVSPSTVQPFYRHSLWMRGGSGWPWVTASGIQGVQSIRLETIARATQVPSSGFSVRWTGFVHVDRSETNTFYARGDGSVRLWIDGFPVLDSTRYKAGAAPAEVTGRRFLESGRDHSMHLEYVHPAAGTNKPAFVSLSWSSPTRPKSVIPENNLKTPDAQPGKVAGVYFPNVRASGPGLVRMDSQIGFDWGTELPECLRKISASVAARERRYTVRLLFAEPDALSAGDRVFDVSLQGKRVIEKLDILKESGGALRGILREFRGVQATDAIQIEFAQASAKPPLICGMELIEE